MRHRTMKERIISIIMAAAMVTGGIPAQALGEGEILYTDDPAVISGLGTAGEVPGDFGADITNETAGDISAPIPSDAGSDQANGDIFDEYQGASEEDFDLDSQEQEVTGDELSQEDPGTQNAGGEAGAPAIDYSVAQRTLTVQLSDTVLDDLSGGADQLSYSAGRFWEAYYGHMPMESLDGGLYEETVAPGIEDARAPLAIEVSGMLPGNIRAVAEFIEYGSEEAFSEDALLSFVLRFEDENGQPYTPESELTVVIGGHNLAAAMSEGQSLLVYDFREDPEREDPQKPGDYKASATVYRDFSEETGKSAEEIGKIRSRLFYLQPRANTDVLLYQDNRGLRVNRAAGTVSFPLQKASAKMIVTAVEPERTLTGTSWDGAASFTVQGMFSADTAAELERHDSASADLTDYDGILAAAGAASETGAFAVYDFAFISEEAGEYTPDRPVSAVIYDAAVGGQVMSGNPLTLYQILEDGSCVPVAYAGFSADGVSFTADRLDTLVVAAPVTGNGAGLSGEDGTDLEDAGSLIEDDEPGSEYFEDDLGSENPGDDDFGGENDGIGDYGNEDQQIIDDQTEAGTIGDILSNGGEPVVGDGGAIGELLGNDEMTEATGGDVSVGDAPVIEGEDTTQEETETDYPDDLIEDWTEEATEAASEAAEEAAEETTEEVIKFVTEEAVEEITESATDEVIEFVTEEVTEDIMETLTEAAVEFLTEAEAGTETATEAVSETEAASENVTETLSETETEEEAEKETEEVTETETEVKTEAETESETETEEATEQTTEVITEASTEAITESETESISEVESEAETEQSYPAKIFEGRVSGVSVLVDAPEGAFPEGTTMNLKRVLRGDVLSEIREAVTEDFVEVQRIQAVDISFLDGDSKEVEPLVPASVVMSVTGIRDEQDAVVVHVNDEGAVDVQTSEVVDTGSGGTALAFDAGGFSLYAIVVTETIETRYIDAQGNTYIVEVGYGEDAGIPAGAELEVTELDETSAAYGEYVKKAAEALGKEVDQFAFAHAFDITLVDPETGAHYQPTKDVKVSIDLLSEDVRQGDQVDVVHFRDSYVENDAEGGQTVSNVTEGSAEIIDASVVDGVVEFESAGFSVYVVSGDQRGYYFKFMSPEGNEYVQLRQTIYDGDRLVQPVTPSEHGRVFKKWTWKGYEGTGDVEDFNGWGQISVPVTQRGMEDVLITAVFEDNNNRQYHIIFNDQDENVYEQQTLSAGTHVDPNGTEDAANKVSYIVIQKKAGQFLTFGYWTEDLYDLDTTTGKPKPFQPEDINRDISLYPYCPQAHWLHFDTNRKAVGGQSLAFVAPKVILEGEVPVSADVPTANGYVFDGWWTKAGETNSYQIYDENGAAVAATVGDWTYAFEQYLYTGGNSLDYDPTLYAHWKAQTTSTYTVGYYVQNPDNPSEYQFRMLHESSEPFTGRVGQTVGLPSSDADIRFPVLSLNDFANETGLEAAGLNLNTAKSEKVTIAPGGTTAFKVYFDRKEFTLSFWNNVSNGHGSGTKKASITALYGAYIADQWPKNKNEGVQWLLCSDTNSNKMTVFTMPAENIEFTDSGISTGRSWERLVHLQNIADDSYGNSNNAYTDTRTTASGANMQIYASVSTMIQIPGFDLVQIVGSKTAATQNSISGLRDKAWVKAGEVAPDTSIGQVTNNPTEVLYFYKKSGSNNTGQVDLYFKRHKQPLTLRYKLDGQWVTDISTADAPTAGASVIQNGSALKWDNVKFDADLSNYLFDYSTTHSNLSMIKGATAWWFWDEGLTQPVQPGEIEKMPDRPIVLYMGMRTSYHVDVDPQGGELDGIAQSTYFSVGKNEALAEYNLTRDYVEWSELYESKSAIPAATKLYKYVYNNRANNDGTRSAKYVEMTAEERADNSITAYVYYPGLWQFQYWYEDGHPNLPFDFVTPPNRPITLKAKWVHAGNYSIVYDASSGGRSYRVPIDSETYLEGANAVIKASVDQPGDKQFRFWATAAQTGNSLTLPAGVEKFTPNQTLTIDAKYTPGQMEQRERTITLYAWYEDGAFTSDSFADYDFYLPIVGDDNNVTWKDGQEGRENIPYYKQTISPGEKLIMPVLPSGTEAPAGTFIGWYEEPEFINRFTRFGEISTPINTRLYARFAEVHTVTYKESAAADARTITIQTYFDGELLSTLGEEFITTADKYVRYWAGSNGVNYYYLGKGVYLSEPGTGYDASDVAKNGHVKGDLVMTPVLGNVYTLSFDSQGGSYVAPIEMPHDYSRWVAEPLTNREAFRFDGWFTAPKGQTNSVYPDVEGGVQYLFDKPLTIWAADPDGDTSTTAVVDLTQNNPLRLYAHWTPTGEPIPTTVKVNYWIQKTDRTGYFLWNSETVSEHDTGAKIAIGDTYDLTDAQKSTEKIAGYETFPDGNDATDDRAYFELSEQNSGQNDDVVSYKTETSKTALENGATTLNVYFNRRIYTLRFTPDRTYGPFNEHISHRDPSITDWFGSDQYVNVTYTVNGAITYTENEGAENEVTHHDDPYIIQNVWLGMDTSALWPKYGTPTTDFTTTYTPANITASYPTVYNWQNTYYFTGWTEYRGTSTTNKTNTFENVAASQAYIGKTLLPDPAQTTYTLQAEYVEDSNPEDTAVTVHYMLRKPGATGTGHTTDNYYEAPEYEQVMYGITGNPSSYSTATWNKILSQATPVDGYERENYREARAINETVYVPLYTYSIPRETYYHRFGNFGNLLYAEIYVGQNTHTGTSTDAGHPRGSGVREGQYSLYYHYLIGRSRYLSNSDGVYQMDPNALFHNSFEVTNVMSVSDLRAILEGGKRQTGWDQVTYAGDHVYLYYEMQSYPLTLKSAETGATLKTATVQYSKYLTNEDGTLGYIRASDGLNYTPPAVPGRSFAFWSVSKDSTSPWEGAMPNQPFELWAHYEDTQVTVTALGVQANGALRRDSANNNAIIFDGNDVPTSWGDDSGEGSDETKDFVSLKKAYGTRLQEFELPTPALESGEIFYGWRRVDPSTGKMVGSYLSNTQGITADTIVAPHIVINQGGYAAYYTNGATNEDLTTETKYGESGFLYDEGGYYFGASARAKKGTSTGLGDGVVLMKDEFAFVCWNTDKDGGGTSYYPGDSVPLPDTGVIRLYAQYSEKREITLVYHINLPGDFTGDPQADQAAPGFVKLPLSGPFDLSMVDQGLNGKADNTGIETETREDTNVSEKVLKIEFKDYLEDSAKYPNSQYPSSVDSEKKPFVLYCPGHTFLHWNTKRDGSDETSLRTDDVRINTLNKDANGEIHLYAQWEAVVLPVQVYEVTPGNIADQYRLRVVSNSGSATHINAEGQSSTVTTPIADWGNPYNSYLKSDTTQSYSAIYTAVEWYKADVRHGVDPKDSYLKTVIHSADPEIDETEIRFMRFDSVHNVWQYASTDGVTEVTNVPDADWKGFSLGDELKIYYQRPQYMVYYNYNGGTDADGAEYTGESAEEFLSGVGSADMPVISGEGVTRNGYALAGWSLRKADGTAGPRADLGKDDPLPTDAYFYKVDAENTAGNDVIPITKTGSGETLAFTAGRTSVTRVTLYQAYNDSLTNNSVWYAVWKVTPWVCQITDGGVLLYYNSGTNTNPVYTEAKFSSIRAAYDAMGKLYVKNGDSYTPYSAKFADAAGKDTRLEMLVPSYELQRGDDFTWGANAATYYKLTWTTAPAVLADNNNVPCTIIRGNVGLNYNLDYCNLTLADITLDNSGKGSGDGGIFDLKYNNATGKSVLILNSGSTLQNAKASGHGGAVDVENGELIMNNGALIHNCDGNTLGGGAVYLHIHATFTMNGGTIRDCKSARGGAVYCSADNASFTMNGGLIENCESKTGTGHGGAVDVEDGIFTMNGGTIQNCTAKNNGGAIYIHAHDTFIMNGGLITGCSAEGNGSVVYINDGSAANPTVVTLTGGRITGNAVSDTERAINFNGPYCKLNISGSPYVYDNVTADGVQRNIDLTDVRDNQVNNIITVNGTLSADARIGVYAPDGHKEKGEQFGNYLNNVSTDNFDIFKNDRDRYLVGLDGGSNKLVWGPVICKIVETTAANEKIEHVFSTLNSAVNFARINGNGNAMSSGNPVKIEMLVDYEIPGTDKVALGSGTVAVNGSSISYTDNILFTTAPTSASYTGESYLFSSARNEIGARVKTGTNADSTSIAILARKSGFTNDSLFRVSHVSAILTVEKITIDGASITTTLDGGLIAAAAGKVEIHQETELRKSRAANGGALYVAATAVATFYGGEIDSCVVTSKGGGIYNAGTITMEEKPGDTSLKRGTIEHCEAANGGGIYNTGSASLAMTGGAIEYCEASDNGGGIYNDSRYSVTTGSGTSAVTKHAVTLSADSNHPGIIDNCTAVNGGGGIYVAAGELDMTHGSIRSCSAQNGGGVYTIGVVHLSGDADDNIDHCRASKNGGGIYIHGDGSMVITGGTIQDCSAEKLGGAIYDDAADSGNTYELEATNLTIRGHSGGANGLAASATNAQNGGGIYMADGTMKLTNCSIYDCTAANDGGAIYQIYDRKVHGPYVDSDGKQLVLDNVTIDGHAKLEGSKPNARYGGAVYIYNGYNNQSTESYGNNTWISPSTGAYATHKEVSQAAGPYLEIKGGYIYDCTAEVNGGAIYCDSPAKGNGKNTISLTDGVVINGHDSLSEDVWNANCNDTRPDSNQTNLGGGAIYFNRGTLKVGQIGDENMVQILNCTAKNFGGAIFGLPAGTARDTDGERYTAKLENCLIDGHTTETTLPTDNPNAGLGGGAVYMKMSTVTIEESILRNLRAPYGAAILGRTNDGGTQACTVTIKGGRIENNIATASKGGAVNAMSGLAIKDAAEDTTVERADDGFKALPEANANSWAVCTFNLEGNAVIYNNFGVDDLAFQQKNLVLTRHKAEDPATEVGDTNAIIKTTAIGLGADAHIGVYVTGADGMDGNPESEPYELHGGYEDDFGTYGSNANLHKFTNDRNGMYGAVCTLTNGNHTAAQGHNKSSQIIRWESYLCKLTDGNGRLLYMTTQGGYAGTRVVGNTTYYPAVYMTLTEAFNAMNGKAADGTGELKLYKADGTEYTISYDIQLHMLRNYTQPGSERVTYSTNRAATFTTANVKASDNAGYSDGDFYVYSKGSAAGADNTKAAITRGQDGSANATSMLTVDTANSMTFTDIIFDGAKDSFRPEIEGGIVNLTAGTLNLQTGAILRNSQATRGGAIYAASGATVEMANGKARAYGNPGSGDAAENGATIDGNAAADAGAGIYLKQGATLNLSGNPSFGGTDRKGGTGDDKDDLLGTQGNFVLKDSAFKPSDTEEPKNGGKDYLKDSSGSYKVRQDIYIEGYLGSDAEGNPTPATGLNVTGAISNTITNDVGTNDGSIWVWAEIPGTSATDVEKENNHYRQLKQFAVFTDDFKNLTDEQKAGTIRVFRNAADDARTENGTDSYLTGMLEGDLTVPSGSTYAGYIYWNGVSGNRKVVLRKVVKDTYASLPDAVFTIWKGSTKVTGTDIDGQTDVQSFKSGSSGVFYTGILDYGTYLIEETTAPDGYQKGWYYFILDGDHAMMSAVFTGADAKAKAKAEADAYNKAINLANKIINGKQTYDAATAGLTDAMKDKVDEMLRYAGHGEKITSGS